MNVLARKGNLRRHEGGEKAAQAYVAGHLDFLAHATGQGPDRDHGIVDRWGHLWLRGAKPPYLGLSPQWSEQG